MPDDELLDKAFICRMRLFQRTRLRRRCTRVRWDPIGKQLSPRDCALSARPRLYKFNDGAKCILRRFEKSAMDANL